MTAWIGTTSQLYTLAYLRVFIKQLNWAILHILNNIYRSVHTYMSYYIPIWARTCKTPFLNLEGAHKTVLKVIHNHLKHSPVRTKPKRCPTFQFIYDKLFNNFVSQMFLTGSLLSQYSALPLKMIFPPMTGRKPVLTTIYCRSTWAPRITSKLAFASETLGFTYNKINNFLLTNQPTNQTVVPLIKIEQESCCYHLVTMKQKKYLYSSWELIFHNQN